MATALIGVLLSRSHGKQRASINHSAWPSTTNGESSNQQSSEGTTFIVFVHGLDFNDSQWMVGRILLPRLLHSTQRRIHTSSINLHTGGWLENDHQPEETVDGYITILHEHLRGLGGDAKRDNIVLIGHSLGGLICEDYCRSRRGWMLAQDGDEDPVPVGGVICICSPFDGAKVVSLIPPELRHGVHLSLHRKHSTLLRDIHDDHHRCSTSRSRGPLRRIADVSPSPISRSSESPAFSKPDYSSLALVLVWLRHLFYTALWGEDWKEEHPPIPGEEKLAELSLPLTTTGIDAEDDIRIDPTGLAKSFHRMHMHAAWDAFSGTRLRKVVVDVDGEGPAQASHVPLKTRVTASTTGKRAPDTDLVVSRDPSNPPLRNSSTFTDVCLWHCGHYSAVISSTTWMHIADFIKDRIFDDAVHQHGY
ncbi:hypothetical protein FOZ63_032631 [Perkinsus olseni]|nr:hypothetical protein FOZ63_032631 [Perkinsus olseni]